MKKSFFWLSVVCGLCLAVCGSAATGSSARAFAAETPPAPASDRTISVHLASGRTFWAEVDAQSNSRQLWLRFAAAGATVLRPIDWDRVLWAKVAGEKLSGSELRGLVEQIRREFAVHPVASLAKSHIVMIGSPNSQQRTAPVAPAPADTHRVVSLTIEAGIGRWDENVEPDGLTVRVYPRDATGAIVPVRGTLNVALKVEQRNIDWLQQPYVDAGQWAESVRASDFGPMGAVYRLRFQSIHPEFDDRVRPAPCLVHACLTVPGQGTFEASDYIYSVQPNNPVRDRLQAATRHGDFPGYRYFADEHTDDGRR